MRNALTLASVLALAVFWLGMAYANAHTYTSDSWKMTCYPSSASPYVVAEFGNQILVITSSSHVSRSYRIVNAKQHIKDGFAVAAVGSGRKIFAAFGTTSGVLVTDSGGFDHCSGGTVP